jgi:hypothetical protein
MTEKETIEGEESLFRNIFYDNANRINEIVEQDYEVEFAYDDEGQTCTFGEAA